MYSANQICRMVEFLIDNIFVKFGAHLSVMSLDFQWVPAFPPSLLTDLFLYSYECDVLELYDNILPQETC